MFFFFSIRRRHTRYWRDWSSDVCSSDLDTKQEESWNKDKEKKEIEKKHGFAEDGKWSKLVISNENITNKSIGKWMDFIGQGKIEGKVDFGEGNNKLQITEKFLGKYGTNIILGPKAELHNVQLIEIGGATGDPKGASVSGKTSLIMDIDPNVRGEEGHLIQHAFLNSDKNIVFRNNNSKIGRASCRER